MTNRIETGKKRKSYRVDITDIIRKYLFKIDKKSDVDRYINFNWYYNKLKIGYNKRKKQRREATNGPVSSARKKAERGLDRFQGQVKIARKNARWSILFSFLFFSFLSPVDFSDSVAVSSCATPLLPGGALASDTKERKKETKERRETDTRYKTCAREFSLSARFNNFLTIYERRSRRLRETTG